MKPNWLYQQSGVIAYRRCDNGFEILLVTSSSGKRWTIPKGVVEPGMSPARSAVKEAYEEAGIEGRVHPEPIGGYSYDKWGGTCRVEVFLFEVTNVLDDWPEAQARRREWCSVEEAAHRVPEPQLKALLLKTSEFSE